MGAAIGQVLSPAVGVAISPVPVIALILMLFSPTAARNSLSFALGWVLGLAGVGVVVLAVAPDSSSGTPSHLVGWVKVLIGVLFLLLGVKQWRGRPRAGAEAQLPSWISAVEGFSAPKAFGVGVLLAAVNPKNLGLTIAATTSISSAGLTMGAELVTLAVFVVLASLTILLPIVYYLTAGAQAERLLTSVRDWLTVNSATVMTILFVVLGAKVLGDGISTL